MDVYFDWAVRIPLRDSKSLSASVYRPRNQQGPAPSVLTLTPYTVDSYHDRGAYFASNGYPFIIVDVRGRGNSEGSFRPFVKEAEDAYDCIEWLAAQPFCNGKVAMWGGSYSAYIQWVVATKFPPSLETIVPVASPFLGVDFPMRRNIFQSFLLRWLVYTDGRASQNKIFSDDGFWSSLSRSWYESGRPFCEFDEMLGFPSPIFQDWLNHPEPDSYWDAQNPTDGQYARLQLPTLTITGIYDDDQAGALEHYRRCIQNAPPSARGRHFLVVGPWDHSGTRTPQAEMGGLKFGSASLVDLPRLHLDWYRWTMNNGAKPDFLRKSVAVYVTGAECWTYADTLQELTVESRPLFLASDQNARSVWSSGQLSTQVGRGTPDYYQFDPGNVSGPEIDAEAVVAGGSLTDQTLVSALSGKLLVYQSAPLEEDEEVTGFLRLSAWISIDCPDTDLYASVYEITPDGGSIRLSTDAIRARYRLNARVPSLITMDEPLLYNFDQFTFVSRLIKRGSRLRLVIAPMGRLIEATFPERNYNGGGAVARESVNDSRIVTVRLYHDTLHSSILYVPIGRGILLGPR